MLVSISMEIPSRFKIGDEALFHPNKHNAQLSEAFPCRIERVGFDVGKVVYDVSIFVEHADADGNDASFFYESQPLRNVDSAFLFLPSDFSK